MQGVTPAAQAAYSGLKYATLDPSNAAYLSPVRVIGDVIQSLPTTAALAATAYLTRGASLRAESAALAAGAAPSEASAVGVRAAASMASRFGAASEGVVGAGQQTVQTQEQVSADPRLSRSQAYKDLTAQGYSDPAARLYLAAKAGDHAGLVAGAVDAGTNLVGGKFLGRVIGEGGSLAARAAKGFATEGLTESVQSGGEQVGQDAALREIDPHQSLIDGVVENMLQGLFVGGVSGGVSSSAFGRVHEAQAAIGKAKSGTAFIDGLMANAVQSKTRVRDGEAFRQFVAQHTEGTPAENMLIPAERLVRLNTKGPMCR